LLHIHNKLPAISQSLRALRSHVMITYHEIGLPVKIRRINALQLGIITTSCRSTGSQMPHHSCLLANKVENIDVSVWLCQSIPTKVALPGRHPIYDSFAPRNHAADGVANSMIRYDTRCYFNVRSKADISQLNLPHGNRQLKKCKKQKKN